MLPGPRLPRPPDARTAARWWVSRHRRPLAALCTGLAVTCALLALRPATRPAPAARRPGGAIGVAFRLAAPEVALALHVGDAVDVYAVDGASGGAPPLARDLVVRTPPRTDGLLVLGADEEAAAALAPVAARTRVTVTLHVTDP